MSHDFSVMEIALLRYYGLNDEYWFQLSHDFSVMEMVFYLDEKFNLYGVSIEPRLFSHGNTRSRRPAATTYQFQLSHDFSVMEMR